MAAHRVPLRLQFAGFATASEIEFPMPTLLRFLTVVAVLAGLGYAGVFALANFVKPKPRPMTVTITPDKFVKN